MTKLYEETVKAVVTELFQACPNGLSEVHSILRDMTGVRQHGHEIQLTVRQWMAIAEYVNAVWLSQFPAPFFSGGPRELLESRVRVALKNACV